MSKEFKKYKFPHHDDPQRQYFSDNNPEKWDFPDFLSKFSDGNIKTLLRNYLNALSWVLKHNIDVKLRNHVDGLAKKWKKASNEKLKELSKASASRSTTTVNAVQSVIGNNNVTILVKESKKRGRQEDEDDEESDEDRSVKWEKMPRVEEDEEEEAEEEAEEEEAKEEEAEEVEEEDTVEVLSLWDGWLQFLENYENDSTRNLYNPEASNVIWCGEGVHKRECIPNDLYSGVQAVVKERRNQEKVFTGIETYIDAVLDAPTLTDLDDAIANMSTTQVTPALKNKLLFAKSLFTAIADNVYSEVVDPTHSEVSWNQAILWPILVSCSRYIQRSREPEMHVKFAPGEEELYGMTIAGPATSKTPYYADGVVRAVKKDNMEICLLETSKAIKRANETKKSFDHHKGMFGLLSMLKRVADNYSLASYEKLGKLKLVFLHAHGDAVRIWSMSTPQEKVFVMNKELKIDMPTDFSKKATELLPFLKSCWQLLNLLMQSLDALQELEDDQKQNERSIRYQENFTAERTLRSLVKPKIVKITEKLHAKVVAGDGPHSSPLGPPRNDSFDSDDFET